MGEFYVVAIRPEGELGTVEIGQETRVQWAGNAAGPFATFEEAEEALPGCASLDGEELAIWSYDLQQLFIPQGRTD